MAVTAWKAEGEATEHVANWWEGGRDKEPALPFLSFTRLLTSAQTPRVRGAIILQKRRRRGQSVEMDMCRDR